VSPYLAPLAAPDLGRLAPDVTHREPRSLAHAQRIPTQPRALLGRIRDLVLADALLERKLAAIAATGVLDRAMA